MEKRTKRENKPQQPSTGHPEAQKNVQPGLPDESNSKALTSSPTSSPKERDGRTGHDKDGNQEHRPAPRKPPP